MFEADGKKLSDLLDSVQNHELQLPDFQRGWVWEDNRIRALLASLTLGYPIGAIMLLESGGEFHFKCRNVEGSGSEVVDPKLMILDGQQRLTSTFLSMRNKEAVETQNDQNQPIRRFYYLDIEKALSTSTDRIDAIISVDENKQIRENIGRDIVLDLSTPELEYKNKMIPFNRLSKEAEINQWRNNYQEYYDFDKEIIKQYQELDSKIIQPLLIYKIPIINVLKTAPKEAVCQVFENVNQGGVPLTVFELLTATFAADNFDLRQSWANTEEELHKNEILKSVDNVGFLTAMTLLSSYKKGSTVSCKKRDVLNLNLSDYQSNYDSLISGYIKANKLMTEMKIYSHDDIPYTTQLIPLAVICTILDKEFENVSVKDKLKQWYWSGVFGELYGSANETRFALDVVQVVNWSLNKTNELPKTISDCNFSTMRLLGLQTKNSAAYKGVMAIILDNGAKDWINGMEMSVSNYLDEKSDIHHIFPKDYCTGKGYDKKKWNSIINKTPIFYSTNRYIGGVAPSQYSARIMKSKNIDEIKLKEFIDSHLINSDLLLSDDFDSFIIDRAKSILNGIEKFSGKKITDRSSEDVINYFGVSLARDKEQ